jgi:hypothetical protein
MQKYSIFLLAVLCLAFSNCTKEKLITLSATSVSLHRGETYQIPAQCDDPITYTSWDEYHAKVSASGLVRAQYVGSTSIRLSSNDDTKNFGVTVSPQSNLYPEPNIRFGESKNSVISRLGVPDVSNADGIGYSDYSANAPALIVLFDSNNCVKVYSLMVKSICSSELGTFLGERYVFVSSSNDAFLFINKLSASAATMMICSELYDINYWMVMYAPYNSKDTSDFSAMKTLIKAVTE